ncbi:MAG TPA: DUF4244 domain-containing protein [Actinomycetota bacterium]|nr:DUF4244 domain-containing protein [Actinomycetota bacterium]
MEAVRRQQVRIDNFLCRLKWELGQTTAEYALVLLAAAAVAVALITWASDNNTLKDFFDFILGKVKESAGGE